MDITFEKSVSKFILEAIGCKIDKQGYITTRGNRIKSISNETIKLSEFGGVAKNKHNKMVFVKDNIFDMIQFVKLQESGEIPKKIAYAKDVALSPQPKVRGLARQKGKSQEPRPSAKASQGGLASEKGRGM